MHKYEETKTTRIMMATVRHVTSSSGLRKFQAAWFLLNRGYTDILCHLRDAVRKPRKMENQQLVSSSQQCFSTPVGFGQGFFSKEQCDNTGASPILSWPSYSWFLPVTSKEISIEGTALLCFYWHYQECDGGAEKAFTRCLPGISPTPLQSPTEVYSCTIGLFRVK